ncbi:MAG: type II toxin-antitoxin system HipA family toxin [Myxococcales bacterium]|nr:MAG: type II toxin-antitoxin system HipA family toxin [Myxococcales bacterium]
MSSVARVKLWGRTIGAVLLEDGKRTAAFEYDKDFAQSGIEIAPLTMPLSHQIYRFPELDHGTFLGLPGMLADALPDKFGNAVIDVWLAQQGRSKESFNAIERLCYTGRRGTGALEFEPAIGPSKNEARTLKVDALVALASEILSKREAFRVSFSEDSKEQALKDMLLVGSSAGGARAKALIAWNPRTNEVRSGQLPAQGGFEYWILKFDGVRRNRDKELDDPVGFGAIEYAYHQMAKAAGIQMSPCRLLEEHGRRHFMTKRFDRLDSGGKLHMQSLCALAHYDFNRAGAHSYEQVFMVLRRLGLNMDSQEEQFRRMCFNVVARNQDDHVKNIAFLMDKTGTWSLSPAFDLTFSYDPTGAWTAQHQMSLNEKRDHFERSDFKAIGNHAGLKRGRAEQILDEVIDAASHWPKFAKQADVDSEWQKHIQNSLRLKF